MSGSHSIYRRILDRIQLRFRRARPGSVLILVVALLVLMALIGTAYISTAQTDRYSAQQNSFNTEVDLLVQGVINLVNGALLDDLYSGAILRQAGDGYVSSGYMSYTNTQTQSWLADRVPTVPNPAVAANLTAGGNIPFWQYISSPLTGSFADPRFPTVSDSTRTKLQPTYITFPSGNSQQTYPALSDGTNIYLAADADGDGIADARLFRLPVGEINGVTYYAGVRIIDNDAAINATTAWQSFTSADPLPDNLTPANIDMANLLINGGVELANFNTAVRYSKYASAPNIASPTDDGGASRTDFAYNTLTDALWAQLGQRPGYPGYIPGSNSTRYSALSTGESSTMARQFVIRDNSISTPSASSSQLEEYLPSSVFTPAPTQKYSAQSSDAWFNQNFFYGETVASPTPTPTMTSTMPIRALLIGSNPTSNFAPVKYTYKGPWQTGIAYNFGDWVTVPAPSPVPSAPPPPGSSVYSYVCILDHTSTAANQPNDPSNALPLLWVRMPWCNGPVKTSANTASFEQLWLGYWNVMWDSAKENLNPLMAGVPRGTETGAFRQPLRDPGAKYVMTPLQVLRMRAALAAINTVDLRDSDDDVTSRQITIPADTGNANSVAYDVMVYGAEKNPYITEVYADASSAPGYIAVELYNPFPTPISLANWQLATMTRGSPPYVITTISTTALWTGATAPVVPANGFLVIANQTAPPGGIPISASLANNTLFVDAGIALAFNKDLFLLRPRSSHSALPLVNNSADPTNPYNETTATTGDPSWLVPVDSYDFTGLGAGLPAAPEPQATGAWHYIRPNAIASNKAWHFVYPGEYFTSAGIAPVTQSNKGIFVLNEPRQEGTVVIDPTTVTDLTSLGLTTGDPAALTAGFHEFPIQIANTDFGGPNKLTGAKAYFPYGAFARNGDLLQVTFIGGYRISVAGNPSQIVELTPITMDAAFADDTDPADDLGENVGRFCPINPADIVGATNLYDYSPPPAVGGVVTPSPNWRYHWAMQLFDYLTVQAPHDDYLPNLLPQNYVAWNGTAYAAVGPLPTAVSNSTSTVRNADQTFNSPPGNTEDTVPLNGLININTAPWRVLASLNFIDQTAANWSTLNPALAQAIVKYRDVDDGSGMPHGPFKSIFELNMVPGFRTTFGPYSSGNFNVQAAYPAATDGNLTATSRADTVAGDFIGQNLAITRISNLITTRSDSFTVYIIVQGFRNIGTASPELVVQRRAAFIADRSGVTPSNSTISSLNVPVN